MEAKPQGITASSILLEMWALLSDHTAEQAVAAYGGSTQADSHGTVDVWGPILQTVWEESSVLFFLVLENNSGWLGGISPTEWQARGCQQEELRTKWRKEIPEAHLWGESLSLLSQRQAAAGTSCCSFKSNLSLLPPPSPTYPSFLRPMPDTK